MGPVDKSFASIVFFIVVLIAIVIVSVNVIRRFRGLCRQILHS